MVSRLSCQERLIGPKKKASFQGFLEMELAAYTDHAWS
jgi:hypothetical protein